MEASPSAGQVFSTGLIPTYTENLLKKTKESQTNPSMINTINNSSDFSVSFNKYQSVSYTRSDLANQSNQRSRTNQCNSTHIDKNSLNNTNTKKEVNQEIMKNKHKHVKFSNPITNVHQVITSNNIKASNQSKKNEKNPQYKLEFIVKNDKCEFVKIEHIMLNKYDVSIKIQEVPTTKSPKNIIIGDRMNLPSPNEIEPSFTMNVEKGNITIAPDGRYTVSSGIALKKVTPNGNKVVNKEFSQIILLTPNKNNKQQTSQNNLLTKCAENIPNKPNVLSSSKNLFGAQCYLQQNHSKFSETTYQPRNLNERPCTSRRGKRKSSSLIKITQKDSEKTTPQPIQSSQRKTTKSQIKRFCTSEDSKNIDNGILSHSNSIMFRPIPNQFLKPPSK